MEGEMPPVYILWKEDDNKFIFNMKSKLIPIPYTIGIIKPHVALKEDKVNVPLKYHFRLKK